MYQAYYDGQRWISWVNHEGMLTSAPACTSPGDNQVQCFVRGSNNRLYRRVWNGVQWTIWEDMGVNATSAPTVASWGPNRISLFARGDNGNLLHRYWDGSRWIGWEDLGGNIASSPACVSWGANSLDCVSSPKALDQADEGTAIPARCATRSAKVGVVSGVTMRSRR
jgi:sialidase-1